MSYTKTNWQNTPSTQTPISAANLNHMEQGIYDAAQTADSAQSGVDGLDPRMDLVEQRLDNLIPQGTPTQGNAELIDIRVGANGVTYPDAGSAVRGQVTEIKSALSDLWKVEGTHIVSQDNFVEGGGDTTVTINGYGFTSVLNAPASNSVFGFSMPTVIGTSYSIDVTVSDGEVYKITVTEDEYPSATQYLANKNNCGVGTHNLTFVATTSMSYIWFSQRYNMASMTITDVFKNDGWSYNNLDTDLNKTNRPAQGKAVGDILKNVPNASWLGYDNKFDIKATDIVTDVVTGGGSIIRTITDNNIHLESGGVNSLTSYAIKGLEYNEYYLMEFDSNVVPAAGQTNFKLDLNDTASYLGDTYASFSGDNGHYTCIFKAIDYQVTFAVYLRYNTPYIDFNNIQIRKASLVKNNTYCDYDGVEVTTFHKCVCIGDSLTYGGFNATGVDPDVGIEVLAEKYSYPTYFNKISGIEVTKVATGGVTSVDWWNRYQNEDLSGHDMAIIQLGVNDASPSKLNGWTQASIDAFTNIINKLETENTNIKIYVATTIPAPAYQGTKFDEVNAGIRQLVEDLNDSNVVLVDINAYGHTGDAEGFDAGHLTAYGYNVLARDYIAIISYLMNEHKSDYRFIQFIGTNYHYED